MHDLDRLGEMVYAERPFPAFPELGSIDVQALTRSLQCGMPSEVMYSIDILTIISNDRRWGLPLSYCHDLTEAMCDCILSSALTIGGALTNRDLPDRHVFRRLRAAASRGLLSSELQHGEADANVRSILGLLTVMRGLAFTEINQAVIGGAHGLATALATLVRVLVLQPSLPAMLALQIAQEVVTLLALVGMGLAFSHIGEADVLFCLIIDFSDEGLEATGKSHQYQRAPAAAFGAPRSNAEVAIDALAKLVTRTEPNRAMLAQLAQRDETILEAMLGLSLSCLPLAAGREAQTFVEQSLPTCEHALIVAETVSDLVGAHSSVPYRWLKQNGLSISGSRLLILLATLKDPNLKICVKRLASMLETLATKARRQARAERTTGGAIHPTLFVAGKPLAPIDLMGAAYQNLPLDVLNAMESLHSLDAMIDLHSDTTAS